MKDALQRCAYQVHLRAGSISFRRMTIYVPIKDLPDQLPELTRRLRDGEAVVVTQDGKPVFDLASLLRSMV